jgi:hypothetical protein
LWFLAVDLGLLKCRHAAEQRSIIPATNSKALLRLDRHVLPSSRYL